MKTFFLWVLCVLVAGILITVTHNRKPSAPATRADAIADESHYRVVAFEDLPASDATYPNGCRITVENKTTRLIAEDNAGCTDMSIGDPASRSGLFVFVQHPDAKTFDSFIISKGSAR